MMLLPFLFGHFHPIQTVRVSPAAGAPLTWYLTDASVSVGSDLSLTDPGAEAFRSPVTGWIVATGANNTAPWNNDVELAATAFADTSPPDGSLDTTNGDFWTSPAALTGSFQSGNWTVSLCVRSNTAGSTADGRALCRLFRGPNQDGSSATEITGAAQAGTTITDVNQSATGTSTITFNPGAFSVSGEYLFVQLAWERTGAGAMAGDDVNARIGNASGGGSRVVTAPFAAA